MSFRDVDDFVLQDPSSTDVGPLFDVFYNEQDKSVPSERESNLAPVDVKPDLQGQKMAGISSQSPPVTPDCKLFVAALKEEDSSQQTPSCGSKRKVVFPTLSTSFDDMMSDLAEPEGFLCLPPAAPGSKRPKTEQAELKLKPICMARASESKSESFLHVASEKKEKEDDFILEIKKEVSEDTLLFLEMLNDDTPPLCHDGQETLEEGQGAVNDEGQDSSGESQQQPSPPPLQPVDGQKRARQGQERWAMKAKELREEWNAKIHRAPLSTKAVFEEQLQACKDLRLKSQKEAFLYFLQLLMLDNVVTPFDFIGYHSLHFISSCSFNGWRGFNVNPQFHLEFKRRLYGLFDGGEVKKNTWQNLFRNSGLIPDACQGHWEEALMGRLSFTFTFPRSERRAD
ncbi:hypothetical protein GUITHDRAFT_146830 [Guillardia theta CCMP2712]|uniref:Uncharacterized protein n=1 Tax=Guillardia theta (strain CCMP2712) TaxID=905079 RepID=L1IGE5_GUITC|nr:hypothetical protein GUITHDRAFT_146830 [Guillardia theta CCMP2712]EKX35004.1 hypothetical protein GUITHDRAFT_146830 [Guillardia theta CCMP2712]|eukprot:XP_005821984.1 hypothetical protein GUITHDRAFT_146830 [Guillardia theta CCMP2712]